MKTLMGFYYRPRLSTFLDVSLSLYPPSGLCQIPSHSIKSKPREASVSPVSSLGFSDRDDILLPDDARNAALSWGWRRAEAGGGWGGGATTPARIPFTLNPRFEDTDGAQTGVFFFFDRVRPGRVSIGLLEKADCVYVNSP